MAKRMLIDAAHPEETRVVVTSGTRLEDFDFESSTKKQVKGNIYLAKVTRVEPSLQAAFIDYGGSRHGFLAFSEVHPDYYRIPVGDRRFVDGELPPDDDGAGEDGGVPLAAALPEPVSVPETAAEDDGAAGPNGGEPDSDGAPDEPAASAQDFSAPLPRTPAPIPAAAAADTAEWDPAARTEAAGYAAILAAARPEPEPDTSAEPSAAALHSAGSAQLFAGFGDFTEANSDFADAANGEENGDAERDNAAAEAERVETFGGDEVEDVEEADADERRRYPPARHYKIQEVIKRRQIMLVQVAKEERGNKGAALTTYLSLAGRYCVLMPNTNRGGGVSRKITSVADRRRLKDILEELEIPEGMGVIVRTAGAERSRAEIKRDYEYLLRLWNEIRDLTLKSSAPALIYEEGNLIKRSIRDLYARDIDEVLVEGEEAYKTAKAFMRTLMPSHAKRVQPYRDPQVPLFQRFQIESQIDAIHSPIAQLRSGGYLVINQTEALVAIDVNSGRSTRERNIEETALRTNLEAADEIARQLRLRDLAGLIVIDFIDMEEHRNQIAVERRLKDALKTDRARIQVGRISPFGLLEMSRQRLRPSLVEVSTQPCPHCSGTGFIRSVESTALHVLRSIEEEGIRRRAAEICIYVPINVALYILNQKRDSLNQIEGRYGIKVMIARDDTLVPPAFRLERLRPFGVGDAPPLRAVQAPSLVEEEEADEDSGETAEAAEDTGAGEDRGRRRRPRRRRRTREPREAGLAREPEVPETAASRDGDEAGHESEADRRRHRRGRRGGRRPHREEAGDGVTAEPVAAEAIEIVARAAGEEEPDAAAFALPPAIAAWSHEASFGIETASLAPLAGEPPVPAASEEPVRESEPPPTTEAEEGVAFVSDAERVFEEAGADAAPSRQVEPTTASSNVEVLTVTEKPTNPRRGWWQRLTQP
ncbi:MAG TPA: Rne/Rng family ribonuclease [Stellaceae bacterium]|nr:Rne/Rng family ribonuclease [Stellaceae bacterium]